MAGEFEITIDEGDLGHAAPEFGVSEKDLKLFTEDGKTILIKVFVDGEPAELAKVTAKSIKAKVSSRPVENTLAIVVTTEHDKIINVLEYDAKEKQFRKPVGGQDDEPTLINAIEKAANKIVAAINSQKGSGRG